MLGCKVQFQPGRRTQCIRPPEEASYTVQLLQRATRVALIPNEQSRYTMSPKHMEWQVIHRPPQRCSCWIRLRHETTAIRDLWTNNLLLERPCNTPTITNEMNHAGLE